MALRHDEPPAAWSWHRVGDDGLLVELPGGDAVARVTAALRAAPPEGVVDVVPAARTVLVRGSAPGRDRWLAAVQTLVGDARDVSTAPAPPATAGRLVRIPVVYDGADLADVADLVGLTPEQVVARHAAARYRVAFGGFMPGFAYLTGLDPVLAVPRLAAPRTRVPAGAVAVAGEYSAVYPRATPGGWRLLGRTDAVMFDPTRDDRPALLVPGDEVRFVPLRELVVAGAPVSGGAPFAGGGAGEQPADESRTGEPRTGESRAGEPRTGESRAGEPRTGEQRAGEPRTGEQRAGEQPTDVRRRREQPAVEPRTEGRRTGELEVLATGPLVLVEDAGRPGLAVLGVPRSGGADPRALRAANRLVGNRAGAAVLEVVLGGLVVRFLATTAIALVGAAVQATLDGVPVPLDRAVRAPAGATLRLAVPLTGLRTWLAVRGGVAEPPVLGSRSTDVLSGLGPAPVQPGDRLSIGDAFDGLPEVEPPGVEPPEVEPLKVGPQEVEPWEVEPWKVGPPEVEPPEVGPWEVRIAPDAGAAPYVGVAPVPSSSRAAAPDLGGVPDVPGARRDDPGTARSDVPVDSPSDVPVDAPSDEPVDAPTDEPVDAPRVAPGTPAARVVVLPATWGPRAGWLDHRSRARLADQVWTVTPDSNRVALRWDGPPLRRASDDELPSEGLVLGAVQVPHDGRPVVFGPDHPVTGGYPVVAVLTAQGVARAAQCRPGDRVRLALPDR